MKNQIIDGMPFKEYLSLTRFSKSFVPHLIRSAKHLRYYLDNPDSDQDAKMIMGSLVDCMIFEKSEITSRFWITPATYINSKKETVPWTNLSKTCKQKTDEAKKNGLITVSMKDMEKAGLICKAIEAHPLASQWLDGAKFQQTLLWTDPVTGVECKGRIDALKTNRKTAKSSFELSERIIDLKLTANLHPTFFSRIIDNMYYHVQGAMYHDGYWLIETGQPVDPEAVNIPFSFIVAEYDEPFDVVCYDLDMPSLVAGRVIYRNAMNTYSECTQTNRWDGRSNFSETIGIPQWKQNKILMEGATE